MWEADALLDAIFDHPDDDTPRLVYADWLQEHGQNDYAQFIRLQCAAARCKVWSDEANELWVKIGRVWNRLVDQWGQIIVIDDWPGFREVNKWEKSECLDAIHFKRGFLHHNIPITVSQLIQYPECWSWLPTPASILWFDRTDIPEADGTVRLLHRLRDLRFAGELWEGVDADFDYPKSDAIDELLKLPYLDGLRALDLSKVTLSQSTLDLLLSAPHLGSLNELKVRFDDDEPNPFVAILHLRRRFKRVLISSLPRSETPDTL